VKVPKKKEKRQCSTNSAWYLLPLEITYFFLLYVTLYQRQLFDRRTLLDDGLKGVFY
jgi:hypothetical protein